MLDINAMVNAAIESASLACENRNDESLRILDKWIEIAEQENEMDWVAILAGQASNLVDQMDDLRLAKLYNGKILSTAILGISASPYAHFNLAKAMFRHGEIDSAKQHAARSYALLAGATHETEIILLERILNAWPEVGDWKSENI